MHNSFLDHNVEVLKQAIKEGTITDHSPLIKEYKDDIVDMLCMITPNSNKVQIDAIVSKYFADELGFEL